MRGIVQKDKPVRDPHYLRRVRELPCVNCWSPAPSVAHHISGRARGMGQKISDHDTIPLCSWCHGVIHGSSKEGTAMRKEQERWLTKTKRRLK